MVTPMALRIPNKGEAIDLIGLDGDKGLEEIIGNLVNDVNGV